MEDEIEMVELVVSDRGNLSHDERVRLESLAQSIALLHALKHIPSAETIVEFAGRFEEYIRG